MAKEGEIYLCSLFEFLCGKHFFDVFLPPEIQSSASSSAWKILSIFVVFPSVIYVSYFAKRIREQPEGLLYFPSDATHQEWSSPIIISIFVSAIFWIFK
jgi:hypothetical protein